MAASTNSPLSFRASDDVKQRFQAIIESEPELKANDVFERLLNAYETTKQESNLPEFASEFKDFAAHLNSLNTKFHNACQMVTNAEEKAAQQFQRDLEEKKASIEALTEQVTNLKNEKNSLLEVKEKYVNEVTEARQAKDVADATVLALTADKEDLRKQIENLNSQIESLKQREQDLNKINADQNIKLKESEEYSKKIDELSKLLSESQHKTDLQALELKTKDDLITNYKNELKKFEAAGIELNQTISNLKEENAGLKAQISSQVSSVNSLKDELENERKRNNEIQQRILEIMSKQSSNIIEKKN